MGKNYRMRQTDQAVFNDTSAFNHRNGCYLAELIRYISRQITDKCFLSSSTWFVESVALTAQTSLNHLTKATSLEETVSGLFKNLYLVASTSKVISHVLHFMK